MAVLQVAALTVLLEAAIDNGIFRFKSKMRAKNLYEDTKKYMNAMYQNDDNSIMLFHHMAGVLEKTVVYLCTDSLQEFQQRLAKLSDCVDYKVKLIAEGEEAQDAK